MKSDISRDFACTIDSVNVSKGELEDTKERSVAILLVFVGDGDVVPSIAEALFSLPPYLSLKMTQSQAALHTGVVLAAEPISSEAITIVTNK